MSAHHDDVFQSAEDFRRHADGQIDITVIILNIDPADVSRINAGFIRDRSDNVSRLYAMLMTNLQPERFHSFFRTASPSAWCSSLVIATRSF